MIDRRVEKTFNNFQKILAEELKRRQSLTIDEFRRYEPLFNLNQKSENLIDLSEEFFNRIDPYSPITIMDISGEEIVKLPPIFFPLQAITTDNKDSANKFYSLIQSDIPRLKAEGVQHYIKAFAKSQITKENKEIINTYKDTFTSCITDLKDKYSNKDISKTEEKEIEDINIENIDGLDWD